MTVATAFDVSDIEELLAVMEQWGIVELHLQVEEDRLDLVRAVPEFTEAPHGPIMPSDMSSMKSSADVEPDDDELVTIFAPVVGLFHLASKGFPRHAPRPGDQVQAGQSLGTIELMHIPSDIISPVSGIIEGILVEDDAGVEYGQPLMIIQPYEEVSEDEAGMLPPPR